MKSARMGAEALVGALREHGGIVASLLDEPTASAQNDRPGPAQIAAAGPRAAAAPEEYELLLEMILEGSHLHYGPQRLVRTADLDLALLVGDQLYALGLARLAAVGDLAAVTELADVISLVAEAHASSDAALADAVWEAGAVAIGWGADARHQTAKELARTGDPRAATALREAASVASS
ncbi:MAG TPA: hypothetical protein VGH93_01915 [Solirubrobacteraceae bacterium]